MKKNILLLLSMILILSMFISMVFVSFTSRNENVEETQLTKNKNQHLQINLGSEPLSLHPGHAAESVSKSVVLQLFEGLTRKDLWGQTVNAAASIVKISDDEKTFTFTIRDAKWSNGDPVIAEDFEYAWKWILDPVNRSVNAYQLYYLEGAQAYNEGKGSIEDVGVKALDDKTLEVKLIKPTPNFLEITSLNTYFPINSKVAKKNPDWANEANTAYTTNGSFKLTDWVHGEKIVLEKNKLYWDANAVRLKKITMLMINDPLREISLYEKGDLNVVSSPKQSMLIDEELFYTQSIPGTYLLRLNTTAEPFNNNNFRKALALSINRPELVINSKDKETMPAMASIHPAFFPGNNKGYFKDYDVKSAKQYLQKALEELGYKDVSEIPAITFSSTTNEADKRIAEAIKDMWVNNLGVKVNLNSSDLNTQNEYEVTLIQSLSSYRDPVKVLEFFSKLNTSNDETGWGNKGFQALLSKSNLVTDNNERLELLEKAESLLLDEMPVIPIYFFTKEIIQGEMVQNAAILYPGEVQFKWAYLE